MKVPAFVCDKKNFSESEYDILCNIAGAWNADCSFAINLFDIRDSLQATIEVNDGSEVCDCSGRTWVPNYDDEIKFLKALIAEADHSDYIIVKV